MQVPSHDCGVYTIIIHKDDSERVYVGKSKNIARRWREHRRALIRNRHRNKELQQDFTQGACFQYVLVQKCDESALAELEMKTWSDYTKRGEATYNVVAPARTATPVIATDSAGVSTKYPSLVSACAKLKLNVGRASCHIRGIPKDKYRKRPAKTVNGYVLEYA